MTEAARQAGEGHQQPHDRQTAQQRVTAASDSFAMHRAAADDKPGIELLFDRLIC